MISAMLPSRSGCHQYLYPCSIQERTPYQPASLASGARAVSINHGALSPSSPPPRQNVQGPCGRVQALPVPRQRVAGRGTTLRNGPQQVAPAGRVLPPVVICTNGALPRGCSAATARGRTRRARPGPSRARAVNRPRAPCPRPREERPRDTPRCERGRHSVAPGPWRPAPGPWALAELQRLCHMATAPPTGGEWRAWYARLCQFINQYHDRPDDAGRFARRLLREMDSLWVFLAQQGVEPTHNRAERALRFWVQ